MHAKCDINKQQFSSSLSITLDSLTKSQRLRAELVSEEFNL